MSSRGVLMMQHKTEVELSFPLHLSFILIPPMKQLCPEGDGIALYLTVLENGFTGLGKGPLLGCFLTRFSH